MPREWRFAARWTVWRRTCAAADDRRLGLDAAGAFIDRRAIDWPELLARVRPHERAFVESLFVLDRVRSASTTARPAETPSTRHLTAAAVVIAVSAVQTVVAMGAVLLAWSATGRLTCRPSQLLLACAFGAASAVLAASRDARALYLMAAFSAVASAFARPAIATVPPGWSLLFEPLMRGWVAEALAPAALWRFALDFPRVRRFARFDTAARRAATASSALGLFLVAANVIVTSGRDVRGVLGRFERDDSSHLFWHLFALAALPAVATIVRRARRAPPVERRRVARLAAAIAIGAGPFLLLALARIALPGVETWFADSSARGRTAVDLMVLGGLAAMPVLGSLAVIVDRPFVLDAFVPAGRRERVARVAVMALVALPFGALTMALYRARSLPLGDILAGGGGWVVVSSAVAACVLLTLRGRLIEAFLTRGFRRAVDRQQRLAASLGRLRSARSINELAGFVSRELEREMRATAAHVMVAQPDAMKTAELLRDPRGTVPPLPADSVLVAMARDEAGPLDMSADGPFRALLPTEMRRWVESAGIELAAAITRRDSSVAALVLCGPCRSGRVFDDRDRWWMATLLTGASAWWAAHESGEAQEPGETEDAAAMAPNASNSRTGVTLECPRCGVVGDAVPPMCGCDAGASLAALPRHLNGKFIVERRLGAGGMGIVYLAHDAALDRRVALKTLPEADARGIARLRAEARVMAALDHESLATIYGIELWRRTPILVVEYFPAGTLADRIRDRPLPPSAAVAIGAQLARALGYMHARGAHHQDLKPSNVALTSAGAPKLLDFGLASVAGDGQTAPLGGTRVYLPPDARGRAQPGQERDLWALSVLVLELMLGRNPFAHGAGAAAVVRRVLQIELPDLCVGSRPAAAPLTAFFASALAVDPRLRYQSASELELALDMLGRALRRRPV
jgi:hypothetical protein